MKILYLHQYFATPADSTGTRSYEMAKRWVAAGHQVTIITTERSATRQFKGWHCTEVDGISVQKIWIAYDNRMDFRRRTIAFLKYAVGASMRAVDVGGDVIYATSTPLTILIPAIYAKWRLARPMIFEVRDLWPTIPVAIEALKNPLLVWLAFRLEKLGYGYASKVVVLSPDMVKHVEDSGCPLSRIVVAPNACDISAFSEGPSGDLRLEFPILRRKHLVVYAGTLGLINGVEYLADIAAATSRLSDDIDFLVLGSGKQQAVVESRARELRVLNQNFFMVPPISKKLLATCLRSASLSTSLIIDVKELWANSANKFFDSIAAGVPIFVNYGGWQAAVLRSSGAGFEVPARDANTAARAIVEFLSEPSRRAAASAAAIRLARSKFDRNEISMRVLSAIISVVDDKQVGPIDAGASS